MSRSKAELCRFLWIALFGIQCLRVLAQVPNQRPTFVDNEYITTFKEELPIGSKVIQVFAVDNEGDQISFEMGADAEGKFSIEQFNGWITSNVVIDRESLSGTSIRFTVYAYDSVNGPSNKVSVSVLVMIEDVNDNAPVFIEAPYETSISENAALSSDVFTVSATDVDDSRNGLVTYIIENGNEDGKFSIGSHLGTVVVIDSLDYETVNGYTLTIIAKDNGPGNGLNASTTLKISIDDADDLPAEFSPPSYTAHVQENAAKGTEVITVTARDGDKALNAPVEYLIFPASNPGNAFMVVASSGLITVNGSLNREVIDSYALRVGAVSTNHRAVYATVTITIDDVNDNAPSFVDAPYKGSVVENASLRATVLRVTAVDADKGNNSVFTYHLERANGKFVVNQAGYILVNDNLDRETQDIYAFEVIARESLTYERFQAVASVTLNVTDLNDNNPQCVQAFYRETVTENGPETVFVVQVSATDPDLGSNGNVRYSLVPDSAEHYKLFTIDALNGSIRTAASFDREELAKYTINVRATDQPSSGQGRFGECKVEITVSDQNDNNPTFINLPNKTTVSEGASQNIVFFTVKAIDPDGGVNAAVSYSVSSGNNGSAFSLDPNSGKLSTARALDRETNAKYTLQITATDGGGKHTTSSLMVHIGDINDNSPVFTEPSGYQFAVDEGEVGLRVGIVTAFDEDEGTNAEVVYSLKSVGDFLKFSIDSSTGEITTAVALDRETTDRYNIRVLAKDKKLPSRQTEVPVVIDVTDVNDHRPVFSQRHYVVAVKEQQPAHVIMNLTASDADIGINAAFFFSILYGNDDGGFGVNSATGELSTAKPLDREKQSSYILIVRVSDLHGNHSYGLVFDDTAVVEVIVEDTNDHRPLFPESSYTVKIFENFTTGYPILQLSAGDPDGDLNTDLRYSIVSGNDLERFFIDAYSGVVYVKSPIERDPPNNETSFLLTVMVKDQGESSLNSTTKVSITVFDVNDSPPEFESAAYKVNIAEDAPVGSTVLSPVCIDKDSSTNGQISFAITAGNDQNPPQFTVDSASGVVSLYQPLDYDHELNIFTLTLTATDKGHPALSGNTTVVVEVQNINDNTPSFTQLKYHFAVREGSYVSNEKIIGQVSAIDGDHDDKDSVYGRIIYTFVNQSSYYRDYQWPLDEENGGSVFDVLSNVNGVLKHGAQIVADPQLGNVVSLEAPEAWIELGDFKGTCISNPALCTNGLSVAFWLKFISGQYIISSGGRSGFAAGFDFFHDSHDDDFVLILATLRKEWNLKLSSIPKIWFYASFTWSSEKGLRYFQNGVLTAYVDVWNDLTRTDDVFTKLAVGKPNSDSINSPEYYSNLLISDLLIWRTRLTDEEILHSYRISRHVTGEPTPALPLYVGKFTISTDGDITAVGVLDRETRANYSLDVRASDLDPEHPRYNSTVVEVEVLDTNDNPPVFQNASYTIDLTEHSEIGYVVIKIEAVDEDEGVNSQIAYSIVSGNVQSAFSIDKDSGELKVARDIDRETTHQFVLGVQAKDGSTPSLQSTVQVTVNIVDVNDNSPIITPSSYVARVKENLPAGQSVLRFDVQDADHGPNGQVTFHISSDRFDVNVSTGVLYTTLPLDREENDRYQLTVQATDGGGDSAKSASVAVEVVVEDENDNPPRFTQPLYRVAISENASIGASIIQVSASDPDQGSNGDIAYSLMGGDGVFGINYTTGEIRVLLPVDREARPSGFFLTVLAKDHGYPTSQSSTTQLNITVSDINDNAPRFDKFAYSAEVSEDSEINTVVTAVHAVDDDEGLAGNIVYSIIAGNRDGAFAIDSDGNITIAKRLDRETNSAYELNVTARDKAGDPKSASVEVDIEVLDSNDNPPYFGAVPPNIRISESALPGTPVFPLIAEDPDIGVNKELDYAGYSPEEKFEINPKTGVISTVGKLDFEEQQNYTFFVVAMDRGTPQLNSTTLHVNITVVDENDNNPQFEQATYRVEIWENDEVGTDVVQVKATERDSAGRARIGYNISAGDPEAHFKISFYSGKIAVQKPLDRERVPNYTLRVTATDNGNPPRYGETSVTILLKDVNDRPPVFQFHDYQSEIAEDSAVGSTVITVMASDEDTAENTELKYSILSGDAQNHLNITTVKRDGKYQGVVTVAAPLDRETKGLYKLDIAVSDGIHVSNVSLEIRLSDVNDRNPEFNSSTEYTAQVAENSPGGLLVLRVSATDEDVGSNAAITYSLLDTDNKFTIDANTGEIKTSPEPLDREIKSVYYMTAVATDIGNRKGQKNVVIHVNDVNDNAPVFTPVTATVTVTEGPGTSGRALIQVNASDTDEGNNQLITYSIVDGNIGNAFRINGQTGLISTMVDLNREAPGLPADEEGRGVYTLTVEAADHGSPVQSSTTTVRVLVHDINDNPPVFPPLGYSVKISEGAKANSDVIAAVAMDLDAGSNSRLTYELISGNTGGDFALDSETAMIRTAKSLERQLTFSYTLSIGASDNGKPPRSATTEVLITVGDINDNDPVFNPVNYTVSVYENSPMGTALINVTATDGDSGQNARIEYSVTAGDPYSVFTVFTQDTYGTLQIGGLVDREQKNNYTLTVTAADGGVPLSRKAFATVFVTILDRNDNAPQFFQVAYHGTIVENSGPGTAVKMDHEIRATDMDLGIHAEVRYHLNGSDMQQFTIHPTTGVISVRLFPPPTLDHERTRNYSFYVVAVDEEGSGNPSFAVAKIHVLDANDNIPRFVPASMNISISEDSPLGHYVTTFTAIDPDSKLNGKVSYSVLSGGDGKFDVGRSDGVVRVAGTLDREMKAHYTLNISALDGSYYPLEGFGTVFISLLDVNDNSPTFEQPVYTVQIPENTPVGSYVVNLTAKDPDHAINADITYSMSHPVFTIGSKSGSVTTLGKLDREAQNTYSFTVFARDGGGLDSSVPVNVVVTDTNDNSPYFLSSSYRTDIMEKTPVGTIVLTVLAEDRDIEENGRVVYSIVEAKEDLFKIEQNSGHIMVDKTINRIDLLQRGVINADGAFTFKVVARDNGPAPLSSNVTVAMNIVDAGDDSPVFNSSSYSVNAMENRPPGSPVLGVTVIKQRSGSRLTYSIVSVQDEFEISSSTGVISTSVKLDRERQDYYAFTVQATDNGQTPLSGFTSVAVHVTDDNDNAPQFQFLAPHKMTVMEDAPLGTGVGRVRAVDIDMGQNAVFEYAITHANIGPGQKVISVQTQCETPLGIESGDIRASDMTASSSYTFPNEDYSPTQGRLNNQIFDQVGTYYQGAWCAGVNNKQQFLQIDLRGMRKVTKIATQGRPGSSDFVKEFLLAFSLDGSSFEVHSMALPGNSDGDTDKINRILPPLHARYVRVLPQTWNGKICMRIELYGCESTGQDEVTLPFIINPDTGFVNTSSLLDREQQHMYILIVQAKDKGIPPLNSSTTLEIKVIDTNDNPPVFTSHKYSASVPENAFGGFQVIRVTATDLDEGSNAVMSYAIVEGGHNKFIIEESSGIVRPSGRLDYESLSDKFYVLNISASDGGRPRFTSFAELNITVTDFNDNRPHFAQDFYSLGVSEDSMVDTSVGQVTATDEDSGSNAQIAYSLSDDLGVFSIEAATGHIRLLHELDRETRDRYQVTVTATDNGDHQLSSEVEVFIQVLDVNDNSPAFTRSLYVRKMAESVTIGTVAEVVKATDADIGKNGEVRYSIITGNEAGLFSLNEVTGAITVVKQLDREANDTLKLGVRAKDNGDPQRIDEAEVEFVLTDVNDNAPVVRPQKSTASVFENVNRGTFVYNVNATDDDINLNGQVLYAIMHGAEGKFVIDVSTGVITTDSELNREVNDFYTLIVMARDQGTVPYMDFGTVDVRILDINDNTPIFTTTFGPFSVTENSPVNTTVGMVSAEDEDIGTNAEITYAISGGDPEEMFGVDERTGKIYTQQSLDRERKGQHHLVVSATNLASSPPLSSNTTVRVNVLDTNDEMPQFSVSSYNSTISEATKAGSSIVTVFAKDKDLGTNGRVLYRILHDEVNINVFSINQDSGLLVLQNNIDEEEYRHLTVLVEAKDLGSPQSLAAVIPVYVTVNDVNDNQPIFNKTSYSASVSEVASVGRSVLKIQATDEDAEINAAITYRLISGNELGDFRVGHDGIVFVNLSLDREKVAEYSIIAGAYNFGSKAFNQTLKPRHWNVDAGGYLYDSTTITITLIDVNDNAPEFIRPLFTGGVAETAELNTFVIKIRASDKDTGNFSAVEYRISSGNDGGFFKMDEISGIITSASHFDGKKGQRFTLKVGAFDNHGRTPTNQVREEATVQIFVLLDEQRVTLTAEVDPSLIERNRDEFISVLNNITEADVYIEAIFKVFTEDKDGKQRTNSEVVFHAVDVNTQTILTSDNVLSTIERHADQLETLYARWKIRAPISSTVAPPSDDDSLSNAELALIILGAVVALVLLIGLCFTIKTRCRVKKPDMHNSPKGQRKSGELNRQMQSLGLSYESGAEPSIYSSKYALTRNRNSAEDRIWDEGDYYLSQDSRVGSYLDDDGDSEHGAAASEISQTSSTHSSRVAVDGMMVTKM